MDSRIKTLTNICESISIGADALKDQITEGMKFDKPHSSEVKLLLNELNRIDVIIWELVEHQGG